MRVTYFFIITLLPSVRGGIRHQAGRLSGTVGRLTAFALLFGPAAYRRNAKIYVSWTRR